MTDLTVMFFCGLMIRKPTVFHILINHHVHSYIVIINTFYTMKKLHFSTTVDNCGKFNISFI